MPKPVQLFFLNSHDKSITRPNCGYSGLKIIHPATVLVEKYLSFESFLLRLFENRLAMEECLGVNKM